MIVTSVQPCFIPWLGYFEQMLLGEVFIYLDDVQYTKKDWRNRNKLLSPNGVKNVFVPVSNASRDILISEALISYDQPWQDKLLNQLMNWYKKAAFYEETMELIEPKLSTRYERLVDLNYALNDCILDYLRHDTRIIKSSDIRKVGADKNERIIELCQAVGGTLLYDGKSASDFIDIERFKEKGISVQFQDYTHRPYNQLFSENFTPYLSIIDLLMNKGNAAKEVILTNKNLTNERLTQRRKKVSSM